MPRQKLSDALLKGSKLGSRAGQTDYWDTLTPGFGVRVSYGGRKSFVVLTRIGGRVRRFTLKPPYPMLSLADARAQAACIIKNGQVGLDPTATARAERRNTFAAVAADFMQDHAKHLRTCKELQRKINVELLPHWGTRPISTITRADVKELLRNKARQGPVSANRTAALVSKLFAWALDEEIIEASPAVHLPRLCVEQERERSLSEHEIRILWDALTRKGYPFGPLFKFLLVTGQRRGEAALMGWSEIEGNGWLLPGARAKSGQGHRVPLSTLALEILDSIPQTGDLVFSSHRNRPLQGWSKVKIGIDALCAEQIPDWRFHDLRRTMATHMRSIGIDRLVVSKLLNHAEGGITRIYDRYAADPEKAAAMERWANRLRGIISGRPAQNVVQFKDDIEAGLVKMGAK
jgi:integrase